MNAKARSGDDATHRDLHHALNYWLDRVYDEDA
jgi:hypothetical protein